MTHFNFDQTREERCGFPEMVYAEFKTPEDLLMIIKAMLEQRRNILATRCTKEQMELLKTHFYNLKIDSIARTISYIANPIQMHKEKITILSGGTSDKAVVLECQNTLDFLGFSPTVITDVGVAGIHRLLAHEQALKQADALIVIAGMEGALVSVVAGLTSTPVIGVPTSIGYGIHRQGECALHAMLSSCASGITVVNIDNGFGAACAINRIFKQKIN